MRVTLNGIVAADEDLWIYQWFGYAAFSPAVIRQALRDNPQGEELVLEINSPGGSVFAGNEMYSLLRSARSDRERGDAAAPVLIRAEIQSVAASAASYLCLGCDQVWISPVAQMMIHLPGIGAQGNYHTMDQAGQLLRSVGEGLLNAYELRCAGRTDRATLQDWMENETWLKAQDAVAAGLVDGILYMSGETPLQLPEQLSDSLSNYLRISAAASCLPDLQALRARAEREKAARDEASGQDGGEPPIGPAGHFPQGGKQEGGAPREGDAPAASLPSAPPPEGEAPTALTGTSPEGGGETADALTMELELLELG